MVEGCGNLLFDVLVNLVVLGSSKVAFNNDVVVHSGS